MSGNGKGVFVNLTSAARLPLTIPVVLTPCLITHPGVSFLPSVMHLLYYLECRKNNIYCENHIGLATNKHGSGLVSSATRRRLWAFISRPNIAGQGQVTSGLMHTDSWHSLRSGHTWPRDCTWLHSSHSFILSAHTSMFIIRSFQPHTDRMFDSISPYTLLHQQCSIL